ncbi:MAG: hypothetical protein NWT00_00575 [Beijerinckiaceae bacterium]|nr:hypothetical protein [Beijerinckiaceae bacterium]
MSDLASRGSAMTLREVLDFLENHFPQIGPGNDMIVEALGPMTAQLRLAQQQKHLRPGGTISGPSMCALADVAIYVAILGEIGVGSNLDKAMMSPGARAVTTNINITRK